MEPLRYAILGLGAGALIIPLGLSIVVIHRGSGVLCFAAGGVAMLAAFVYRALRVDVGVPTLLAAAAAVATGGVVCALFYALILRWMSRSSATAKIVASLGLMTALQATAQLVFAPNGEAYAVKGVLPTGSIELGASLSLGVERVWLLAVGVVLGAVLWAVFRWTRFGLAVTAVSENRDVLASMGIAPDRVAWMTWTIGGLLMGAAGVLISPITGIAVNSLTLLVIPALTAALLGRFNSIALTILGCLGVGIIQSEVSRYVTQPGWPTAIPLLVVIVVLIARGSSLPGKSSISQRLPRVTPGATWRQLAVLSTGLGILVFTVSDSVVDSLTVTVLFTVIGASVVVVSGFAGQLSLVQLGVAGLGAYLTALLAIKMSMPILVAVLLAALLCIPIGCAVAIPALRTRDSSLAVATLALAVVLDQLVLNNAIATKPLIGPSLPTVSLADYSLSAITNPRGYLVFCSVALVLVAILLANLRRSAIGRRLLAVRANERAAASLGISVSRTKVYAFGLGSFVAAFGGGLTVAQFPFADFTQFTVIGSITLVLQAALGGIGWFSGAAIGALSAPGGLLAFILSNITDPTAWLLLLLGVGVMVVMVQSGDGLAPLHIDQYKWVRARLVGRRRDAGPPALQLVAEDEEPNPHDRVRDLEVAVSKVTVSFGAQDALQDVDFCVRSGEIVGVIGPNGAGKSTLIDVMSGFQRPTRGEVLIDGHMVTGQPPHRYSRAGIVRTFQSLELFEDLSVIDNVLVAAERPRAWTYLTELVRPTIGHINPVARSALQRFGLADQLGAAPGTLDYAARRMLAIARAMATSGSVLCLDEPAAGLDATARKKLAELIVTLVDHTNVGVLLVEHDTDLVFSVCQRVVVLDRGRIIAEGTPDEMRAHSAVRHAYLGAAT